MSDDRLRTGLKESASLYFKYDDLMLLNILKSEELVQNNKQNYWLYGEEKLQSRIQRSGEIYR